uniref:Uncharacterized protein n=1 Tax=Rhizophora mucronata TaxID=61149 RepID=A0A2P2QSQ0_RHIMU
MCMLMNARYEIAFLCTLNFMETGLYHVILRLQDPVKKGELVPVVVQSIQLL